MGRENELKYEKCAHCWHFIEPNYETQIPGYAHLKPAEYVHLDDGEKEHDHDAAPSGDVRTLDEWKHDQPSLFQRYADGSTGPNSPLFKADHATAWECASDCDTCWFLISDTAANELGEELVTAKLRAHLASGHVLTSDEADGREQVRLMDNPAMQDRAEAVIRQVIEKYTGPRPAGILGGGMGLFERGGLLRPTTSWSDQARTQDLRRKCPPVEDCAAQNARPRKPTAKQKREAARIVAAQAAAREEEKTAKKKPAAEKQRARWPNAGSYEPRRGRGR